MTSPLLGTFRFQVALRRSAGAPADAGGALCDGAFQECSGLEIEVANDEYTEGGRNDGVVQRAGRAKCPPLVLKRGMFLGPEGQANSEIWEWIRRVVSGELPVPRYDGWIQVMSEGESVAATWSFVRGLPARVRGPVLNATTGEVAIEELQIVHEGLRFGGGRP